MDDNIRTNVTRTVGALTRIIGFWIRTCGGIFWTL